jgi:hypothetical protein
MAHSRKAARISPPCIDTPALPTVARYCCKGLSASSARQQYQVHAAGLALSRTGLSNDMNVLKPRRVAVAKLADAGVHAEDCRDHRTSELVHGTIHRRSADQRAVIVRLS